MTISIARQRVLFAITPQCQAKELGDLGASTIIS
jgi:hypothetical protein